MNYTKLCGVEGLRNYLAAGVSTDVLVESVLQIAPDVSAYLNSLNTVELALCVPVTIQGVCGLRSNDAAA